MKNYLEVSAQAKEKYGEIVEGLAKATGVEVKDVEKIMNELNLAGSLAHREYKVDQVQRFNIPIATRTLRDVDMSSVRIATSDVAL